MKFQYSLSSLLIPLGFLMIQAPTAQAQCLDQWTHHLASSTGSFGSLVNACNRWDPDGAGPAPERVVVTGFFHQLGSLTTNSVAQYDTGSQVWSPIGSGRDYEVVDSAGAPNGDLIVVGLDGFNFPLTGPVDVWDGAAWTSLPPMNGQAASVAVLPNGDIVVGGTFTMAGNVPVNNVARWDGSAWHAMGTGIGDANTQVRAMHFAPNGTLVASSVFSAAPETGLQEWNGATWVPIAMGTQGQSLGVTSFHFAQNGDILASGAFLFPSTGSVRTVARWNGTDWTSLGAGITSTEGPVVAVTELPNGDVVASGFFATAGGVNAINVARFDGTDWMAMGPGLGAPATTDQVMDLLTTSDNVLFATGSFDSATGGPSSDVASMDVSCTLGSQVLAFCDPNNVNSTGASTALNGVLGSTPGSGLHLECTNGVSGELGYFLVGNQATPGISIGDGTFCLVGSPGAQFFRYNQTGTPSHSVGFFDGTGVLQNVAGTSTVGSGFDVPQMIPSVVPTPIVAGDTWHFQVWHRDTPAGLGHSNFSNGLSVTF